MLIGGALGGVAFFLLGWLLYGILMADTMAGCMSCQRPMAEMNMVYLIGGNLILGLALSYMMSKWTGTSDFMSGLKGGALFGLLLAMGYDSVAWATSTMYTDRMCMVYDVVMATIMWGIAAGLIGWWNGRK